MNIEKALRLACPEPRFEGRLFTQEDYENRIVWLDARPKPTWEVIVLADSEITSQQEAEALAKAAELSDIEELRSEYGLGGLKGLKIKQLKQAVKNQLQQPGGLEKAIEQLAIGLALIERKVYGKL